MKNKAVLLTIISLTVLVLVSCNLLAVLRPAQVFAVSPTTTSTLQTTLALPTQPVPQATSAPTRPPTPKKILPTLASSVPTITATAIPCNKAVFVSDVSVPDGAVFHPGDAVVKTWQVMNAGSCTWTTDYKLIFDHGYNFLGVKSINLATPAAPGETANITLKFSAPAPLGTYESYWNLQGPAGVIFGTGSNGDGPLGIKIVIQPKPKP
jgi:hypothetical protein